MIYKGLMRFTPHLPFVKGEETKEMSWVCREEDLINSIKDLVGI